MTKQSNGGVPAKTPSRDHSPFLKNLMQNLIYPAVLGSILYTAVQVIATPAVASIAGWRHFDVAYDPATAAWNWQKVAFLLLMLVFYHCDYFYMAYTKTFGWWFFAADWIFIGAMYVTLVAINPLTNQPPVRKLIGGASLVFVIIYFAWDVAELRQPSMEPKETMFYKFVLAWEALSGVALLGSVRDWRWLDDTQSLLWILTTSTLVFIIIVVFKKRFFDRSGSRLTS
jgi:hypothetical protein